jgi:DNA-directed RNA polymerase subunit RPC12/RpoP
MSKYVCPHCGAEVWWGLPQPTDPCYECGKPIGPKPTDLIR